MATAAELAASLKDDGYNVSQPGGSELPPMVGATPPTAIEQIVAPAKAMATNPLGVIESSIRGVEKSFGDFVPNLTERIEGTINFPIIRGAELAAKYFSNEDHKPELTSLKQIVDDRIAYTQALRDTVPGWVDGTQAGIAAISGKKLLQEGFSNLKSIVPDVWNKSVKLFRGKSSTKLAEQIIPDVDGPPLDAIINHPEKVLELVKNKKVSLNDVATEISDELVSIKKGLGENSKKHQASFVADPTKRIVTTEPVPIQTPQGESVTLPSPLQVVSDFRKSKVTDKGKSILGGTQTKNLTELEEILTPNVKTIQKTDPIYGVSRGLYQEMGKDISPKDAMLAIEQIDDIIDYERIAKGKLESSFIDNLFNMRRTLKYQMRGNNLDWFKADEDYANFMEIENGMINKLGESNSAESFIDNIFGMNKERTREKLITALNYRDHLDSKITGSGDAFFRRMAVIQGARKIKRVQGELTRVQQAKAHEIVRYWVARGVGAGSSLAGTAGAMTGGIQGASIATPIGAAVGGYAGYKIGIRMADPIRILNAAIREKNISLNARKLAHDLIYVHKNYGNDGIISMLDIIGPIPALNEIMKFSGDKKQEKEK